jgi:hypothetical protein
MKTNKEIFDDLIKIVNNIFVWRSKNFPKIEFFYEIRSYKEFDKENIHKHAWFVDKGPISYEIVVKYKKDNKVQGDFVLRERHIGKEEELFKYAYETLLRTFLLANDMNLDDSNAVIKMKSFKTLYHEKK